MKYKIFLLMMYLSISNTCAQKNDLTLEEYSNIKIDNVFLVDIIETRGDIIQMQNLFDGALSIQNGYNETVENWGKFNTSSLFIEFYNGIEENSVITYDLASINIKNNNSSITIKDKTVTIGDNSNELSNLQIRTYNGKKMIILALEDWDSYVFIYIDSVSNLITEIGYNGNLL